MLVADKSKMVKKFCPSHLADSQRSSITSAVYNHDGTGECSGNHVFLVCIQLACIKARKIKAKELKSLKSLNHVQSFVE